MKNHTKFLKGKKALSLLLAMIMVLSVASPMSSMLGVTAGAATTQASDAYATIITASDFQDGKSGNLYEEAFSTMIQKAKAYGLDEPAGFILGGDYDGSYANEHNTPTAYRRVEALINEEYPYFNKKKITNIQGNHDVNDPSVIDETGPHEYEDYIVYVINNDDYPAGTGGTNAYHKTIETNKDLVAYFNQLKARGETRPIFIATHIPLHHNSRNPKSNNKDSQGNVVSTGWNETLYSRVLFETLNEQGKTFDIIFLFGHNHSGDYDDYIGGSVNYIGKGDTIRIPDYNVTPSETSYTEETLNFTYMNYGYVGYSNNVVNNTLTMNTFEICSDKIVATRYSVNGQYGEAKIINRNMKTDTPSVIVDGYSEGKVGSATGVVAVASGVNDPVYTWSSSNESVASISYSDRVARITYLSAGTATIRVKVAERNDSSKNAVYTYDVTVSEASSSEPSVAIYRAKEQVDGRDLEYYQATLGDTIALSGTYSGLSTNATTAWSSSNTNVAKVNQYGLVTFVGAGTANVTYTVTDNGESYSVQVKFIISTEKKVAYKYVQATTITAGKSYVLASDYNSNNVIYSDTLITYDKVTSLSGVNAAFNGSAGSYYVEITDTSYVWDAVRATGDNQVYLQNSDSGLYLAAYATGVNNEGGSTSLGHFELTKAQPSNGIWRINSSGILQTTEGLKWYPRSDRACNITSGTGRKFILFEQVSLDASVNIEFAGDAVNDTTQTVYLAVNGRQIELERDCVNIQQLQSERWTSSNTNVATIDNKGVVTFKGVDGNTVITYTAIDATTGKTVTASFTLSAVLTAESTRFFKYTETVVPGRKYIIVNSKAAGKASAFSSFEVTYAKLLGDVVNVTVEDGASYIEIPEHLTEVVWTPEGSASSFYLKNDANGKYLYANAAGTYDDYGSLEGKVYTGDSYSTNTVQYAWTYESGSKLYNNFAYTDTKLGAQSKTYVRVRSADFLGVATADESKVYFFEEIEAKPKAIITSRYEVLGETVERTEICPFQTETLLPTAQNFPDSSKVSYAWSSGNATIATIDQNGKVTYTGKAGEVTITLTATSQVQDSTGAYPVATATVTIEVVGGVGYVDPPDTIYTENAFYKTNGFVAGIKYVMHTSYTDAPHLAIGNYNQYSSPVVRLDLVAIDAPATDENGEYIATTNKNIIWECLPSGVAEYVYLYNSAYNSGAGGYLYMHEDTSKIDNSPAGVTSTLTDIADADAYLLRFDSVNGVITSKALDEHNNVQTDYRQERYLGNTAYSSSTGYYIRTRRLEQTNAITLYAEPVTETDKTTLEKFELTDKIVNGQKFILRAVNTNEGGSAISLALSGEPATGTDEAAERLMGVSVTPVDNIITTDNHNIIWVAETSGNYFYLRNYETDEYLAVYKTGNLAKTTSDKTAANLLRYWQKSTGNMCISLSGDNGSIRYKDGGFYESSSGAVFELYAYTGVVEDEPDTPIEDNTPVITEIRKQEEFGSTDITRTMQYRDVNDGDTEQILRYIRGVAAGYTVTWSVSDTSIATIDDNGLLTYTGKTGYFDVMLTIEGEDFSGNDITRTLKTTFNVSADAEKTRIAVPETVYMTPASGASTVGQYYVNNIITADNTIETEAESDSGMYLGIHVEKAKRFSVEITNVTDSTNDIYVGDANPDSKNNYEYSANASNIFDFNADGTVEFTDVLGLHFSGKGLEPGEKAVAKWEITVYFDGNVTKTYTAYTVMYAPQRTVGAVAEARQVEKSQNEIASWITGANGIDHTKQAPLGTIHADKRAFGYFKEDPLVSGYQNAPTITGSGETPDDHINVGSNANEYYVMQAATNGHDGSRSQSFLGLLTVDKSRYTNTNQIPNLRIGYDVFRRGEYLKDSVHTLNTYYVLGTENSFTATEDLSATPSGWIDYNYYTNFAESHNLPYRETVVPGFNVSDIDGKYIHAITRSQAIQDLLFSVNRQYATAGTSLLCTVTDKSTLRERVLSGYNIINGSSEFNDALMNAATILGDPSATQTEIDKTSRELYEAMEEQADKYYTLKYDNLFSAFEYSQFAGSMTVVGDRGTASYLNGTITVKNGTITGGEAYTNYGSGNGYYRVDLKPNTEYVYEFDVTTDVKAQAFMFFYDANGNSVAPTSMQYKVNDGAWQTGTLDTGHWGVYPTEADAHYVVKFTTGADTVKGGFCFGNHGNDPTTSSFSNIKLIDAAHYYEDAQYSKTESIHKEYTAYGSLIVPERPGYIFLGWQDANGSTITGANTASENLTIYSQWAEVQYTVKYNGNFGAGSKPSDTLTLNQFAVTPTRDEFTRDNHTLLGWAFDADAKSPDFGVGQTITVADVHSHIDKNNQVTLYAVWERNYSVYYSSNGGTGEVAHTYNPRSQAHILPDDSTISRDRYVFLGWALEADATEPNFLPGEKFYVGEIPSQYVNETKQEVILHAVWMLKEYVVDDTIVIDFGLPVKINVLANDPEAENGTITAIGKGVSSDVVVNTDGYTSSKLTDAATELKLGNGTAKIDDDGKVVYTPASTNYTEEETFYYEFKTNGGKYYYTTVTVIPATSIYYEESFMNFEDSADGAYKWKQVGNPIENMLQSEDRPGTFTIEDADANNVYGTDDAYDSSTTYSLGSAMFVDVDKASIGKEPYAEFTFTGTGFDLFSVTDNTAGTIRVYIYRDTDGDGDFTDETKHYKNYIVNTYYGYEYNDGAYNPIPPVRDDEGNVTNSNALFQVPVFSMRNIATGYETYKVVIKPMYSSGFDVNKEGHYGIYVDSVRIFDPMGKNNATANEAYIADGEYAPNYLDLRDTIIASDDWKGIINGVDSTLDGSLFFDGSAGNTDEKFDYKAVGPKNEVYLAKGQAIAFNISAADVESIGSIQLGMKLLNNSGNAYVSIMNADDKKPSTITLESATEQFYKIDSIVEWNGNTTASPIVITNTSTNDVVISLTSLKWGYKTAVDGAAVEEISLFMDEQSSALAYSAMERAIADPVDPIAPENIDIETPETVYIEDGKGEIVIKTEPEVEKITVDGTEITDYTVDEDGRRVWKHTFNADQLGEAMFKIVAYDNDGNHSMTIISRTTVIDMDGNDGSDGSADNGETDDGTQDDSSSTEGIFSNDLVKMIFDLIRKILEFLGGAFA